MLLRRSAFFFKKIKNIEPESWVIKPEDATVSFHNHDHSHLNIQVEK